MAIPREKRQIPHNLRARKGGNPPKVEPADQNNPQPPERRSDRRASNLRSNRPGNAAGNRVESRSFRAERGLRDLRRVPTRTVPHQRPQQKANPQFHQAATKQIKDQIRARLRGEPELQHSADEARARGVLQLPHKQAQTNKNCDQKHLRHQHFLLASPGAIQALRRHRGARAGNRPAEAVARDRGGKAIAHRQIHHNHQKR